ncbi:MAG: hypothetical protein NVS1B14_04970 [Vulcanimicrobiaceae bacterium]
MTSSHENGRAVEDSANLQTLLQVSLELRAELGRCRLSIRDLLALGPGAVVELDRSADEPVDLLANGRLVARGEIVAVEDRFGVKLTELIRGA